MCDLAHASGALVYCDIVQAAGATPIDVRATGADFCACSSFKWLMGISGLASGLIAFVQEGLEARHAARLQQARVMVSVGGDRMRISPSVFNDMKDVDRLLEVLSGG